MDTSALLGGAITTVIDTQKLLSTRGPNKQHHYKLYCGDQICTTLEVGDIWSMAINGKECCGITLKSKHMMILTQGEQANEKEEEEEEEEEALPAMNVFD